MQRSNNAKKDTSLEVSIPDGKVNIEDSSVVDAILDSLREDAIKNK